VIYKNIIQALIPPTPTFGHPSGGGDTQKKISVKKVLFLIKFEIWNTIAPGLG
jgi:hypothetical protein